MSGTEYEELMDTIRRAAARIFEYAETEEEAENAQLVILSVGEDDEGEYLDVVDDDELLLELGKLFEERLSDEYDIEE